MEVSVLIFSLVVFVAFKIFIFIIALMCTAAVIFEISPLWDK